MELRKIVLLLVILTVLAPVGLIAAVFNDTFADNPYTSNPRRWCERYHGAQYAGSTRLDAVNGNLLPQTTPNACDNGYYCRGASPSCTNCDPHASCGVGTCTAPCANPNYAGYFTLTENDYAGVARSVSINFRLTEDLKDQGTTGEHVSLWPMAHPNCHAGFQAVVDRVVPAGGGAPYYRFWAALSDDKYDDPTSSDPLDYWFVGECGTVDCSNGACASQIVHLVNDIPTILPNVDYRIEFDINPKQSDPTRIEMNARLYRVATEALIVSLPTKEVPIPKWYNVANKGQRFGFGSAKTTPSKPTQYDAFKSEFGGSC